MKHLAKLACQCLDILDTFSDLEFVSIQRSAELLGQWPMFTISLHIQKGAKNEPIYELKTFLCFKIMNFCILILYVNYKNCFQQIFYPALLV